MVVTIDHNTYVGILKAYDCYFNIFLEDVIQSWHDKVIIIINRKKKEDVKNIGLN